MHGWAPSQEGLARERWGDEFVESYSFLRARRRAFFVGWWEYGLTIFQVFTAFGVLTYVAGERRDVCVPIVGPSIRAMTERLMACWGPPGPVLRLVHEALAEALEDREKGDAE